MGGTGGKYSHQSLSFSHNRVGGRGITTSNLKTRGEKKGWLLMFVHQSRSKLVNVSPALLISLKLNADQLFQITNQIQTRTFKLHLRACDRNYLHDSCRHPPFTWKYTPRRCSEAQIFKYKDKTFPAKSLCFFIQPLLELTWSKINKGVSSTCVLLFWQKWKKNTVLFIRFAVTREQAEFHHLHWEIWCSWLSSLYLF